MDLSNKRRVDVVIPTFKPDVAVGNLIKRLLKQTYEINKIICINTEEKYWDASLELLTDKLEVHHIKRREFGHGKSRNEAAGYSDADIIVFMTQDAKPYNQYLIEKLVEPFSNEDSVWCSYGRQLARNDCMEIERYTRTFNYPRISKVRSREDIKSMGIKAYFCSNSCAAYLKSKFDKLGGFDSEADFGEDTLFVAKILENDGKVAYAADAIVVHSHNYTLQQQFERNYQIGLLHSRHPEIFKKGSSEKEGIRMVIKTALYLIDIRQYLDILYLIFYSGAKYAGYFIGSHNKLLKNK